MFIWTTNVTAIIAVAGGSAAVFDCIHDEEGDDDDDRSRWVTCVA